MKSHNTMTFNNILKKIFRRGSISRIATKIKCIVRSKWYTFRYVSGSGRIIIRQPFLKLRIIKDPSAKIIINGDLVLDSHLNLSGTVSITLGANSRLIIENNFNIGQNIGILLCESAVLSIGGADKEEISGITSDTKIMCYKKITIGNDFLCSWNVFITDYDWHAIYRDGVQISSYASVKIGNHVWIGSNVLIGKGTVINNNVIVGAYSKLSQTTLSEGTTVVGLKPHIVSDSLTWKRSL